MDPFLTVNQAHSMAAHDKAQRLVTQGRDSSLEAIGFAAKSQMILGAITLILSARAREISRLKDNRGWEEGLESLFHNNMEVVVSGSDPPTRDSLGIITRAAIHLTCIRPIRLVGSRGNQVVKNQFDRTVKTVRSDNGSEFMSRAVQDYFSDNEITHQTSCTDTIQQNGRVERLRVYNHEVFISQDVCFYETDFPFSKEQSNEPTNTGIRFLYSSGPAFQGKSLSPYGSDSAEPTPALPRPDIGLRSAQHPSAGPRWMLLSALLATSAVLSDPVPTGPTPVQPTSLYAPVLSSLPDPTDSLLDPTTAPPPTDSTVSFKSQMESITRSKVPRNICPPSWLNDFVSHTARCFESPLPHSITHSVAFPKFSFGHYWLGLLVEKVFIWPSSSLPQLLLKICHGSHPLWFSAVRACWVLKLLWNNNIGYLKIVAIPFPIWDCIVVLSVVYYISQLPGLNLPIPFTFYHNSYRILAKTIGTLPCKYPLSQAIFRTRDISSTDLSVLNSLL
ncbi:hypothetical protein CRG98_025958 [Punica granatum]|uniref:Integrase catalytic domain-containing protein n=1 Tax=Punica granatum TaxID=22663 RepID=A0A2I0JBV1_PUNGR|nr:hypothetical protein CRG98_025958 [Punica granatum]